MNSGAKREPVEHNQPFQVIAVEPCEPPLNGALGSWCQYTISQGDNVMTCVRKGSRTSVTSAATQIVDALNHRRADRRGRVHLVLTNDRKKS
ncbi:MAG: hypothetical protein ACE5G3_10475 [Gammaproteobacteria bacterium]